MEEKTFHEKNVKPDKILIREKLRRAYPALQELREVVKKVVGETAEEWKFYGPKNGWVLKTFLKKRNLYSLGIYEGFSRVTFVFGEKAESKILESDNTECLKKELSESRKYAEGRGLSITIKDNSYIKDIRKLVQLKIEK